MYVQTKQVQSSDDITSEALPTPLQKESNSEVWKEGERSLG